MKGGLERLQGEAPLGPLNLMCFSCAVPRLRGVAAHDERRGTVAFRWLGLAMMGMTLAFGVAGALQTYLERVMGLGSMTAQAQMRFGSPCWRSSAWPCWPASS